MRVSWIHGMVSMAMTVGAGSAVLAAEQAGQSKTMQSVPGAAPSTAASPTSTAVSSSATTRTVTGALTALDLATIPPSLKVAPADGASRTFTIDASTAVIWSDGKQTNLLAGQAITPLKVGQQVKVKYILKGSQELAAFVRVVPTPVASPSASSSAPGSASY